MRAPHHRLYGLSLLIVVGLIIESNLTQSLLAGGVESIDWGTLPLTKFSALEAVNANGSRAYPTDAFPVRLRGILLNNPEDMVDSAAVLSNPGPFQLGAQWQVFVQTVDESDFGGAAVFMGQWYENVPPFLDSYTPEAWQAEVSRVNVDRATGHVFRAGDLVEIHGQGALEFAGKTNINEEHFIASDLDFELALVEAGVGLPTPASLTLADLWDETTDAVRFDPTRQTGGERYQGELVKLSGLHLTNPAAWAANAEVTVSDDDGRLFTLMLGRNASFSSLAAPTGQFDAVGIFDQDASFSLTGDAMDGYRLWIMNASDITLAPSELIGDANEDCTVGAADYAIWAAQFGQSGEGLAGDFDGSGEVGVGDYALWAANFGKTCSAANPVPEPNAATLLALGAAATLGLTRLGRRGRLLGRLVWR